MAYQFNGHSDMYEETVSKTSVEQPVLITGATASGKSELALQIAEAKGGIIVNADASQVYDCWRVITARPSTADEARAHHTMYGHVGYDQAYSVGVWLREVKDLLRSEERLIIVGGTGLYFSALTGGLANIPDIPLEVRQKADALDLTEMVTELDSETHARIDRANRARVQRAWEVQTATGRSISWWQSQPTTPILPLENAHPFVVDADREWLNPRIAARFRRMLEQGALDEVGAMIDVFDATLPAFRAIGVHELYQHLQYDLPIKQAEESAIIATRQYAKRQRSWIRAKCATWDVIPACS